MSTGMYRTVGASGHIAQLLGGCWRAKICAGRPGHRVSPPPQLSQPRVVGVVVQADPAGSGRPAGSDGVQGGGDRSGEFLEASGEVHIITDSSAIKPLADQRDLAAEVSQLRGQGSEALA